MTEITLLGMSRISEKPLFSIEKARSGLEWQTKPLKCRESVIDPEMLRGHTPKASWLFGK